MSHPGNRSLRRGALACAAPATISELTGILAVRPSTVSKMEDRLYGRGLIERLAKDRQDTRLSFVRITPAGLDARSKLEMLHERLEHELVASLGPGKARVEAALADVEERLLARLTRLR